MQADTMGEDPSARRGADRERLTGLSLALRLLSAGPVVILIVLVVILSLAVPNFFTPRNISNILAQMAVIAVVALGQHLVILTRGIDLSVGSNLALATVLGALMFRINDNAVVVMGTMLLPSFMNMIPSFMIMDLLGWIDQPSALYIPGAASAFGIFLMRQFISSAVPRELVEAARMDGCGELGIYARIVLPLLKPALGTLGLITFISSWNNFIGPLVVMRSPDMYTLPLALRSLQSPVDTEWGALMAGSAIATLPLIVLFVLCSRQLISGLTVGAVK